ncbi:hypothetical protein TNCT_630151 [Trichonephila clavata]|uniref:Uncharacterized protein n=1 Tax=Trichonephila clavata TaxID=2740835 RepID=A0A8X6KN23_TRICU|nr:hypothetical protein TNCT_630151 [Trichonephila clavata]
MFRDSNLSTCDYISEKIYWSDTGREKIQRSNLDGSRVENVITKGLGSVDFLAVDSTGRKLYWTDDQRSALKCPNWTELPGKYWSGVIWTVREPLPCITNQGEDCF